MSYEATGTIKLIFDTQTFPSGFKKREFVLTVGDGNYPQDLKFEVVKDKCDWLDKCAAGQTATVMFDVRGNEFNDKYYVNLNCWKLEVVGSQAPEHNPNQHKQAGHQMPDASKLPAADVPADDVPF